MTSQSVSIKPPLAKAGLESINEEMDTLHIKESPLKIAQQNHDVESPDDKVIRENFAFGSDYEGKLINTQNKSSVGDMSMQSLTKAKAPEQINQFMSRDGKYIYPEHVTAAVKAPKVLKRDPSAQIGSDTHSQGAISQDKKISKRNETTNAMQSYIESLKNRQKVYINEQIKREAGKKDGTTSQTQFHKDSQALEEAAAKARNAKNQPKTEQIDLKVTGLKKFEHLGAEPRPDSPNYLFNIRKRTGRKQF